MTLLKTKAKKLLILAPAHTGDMVMTNALFKLIKQQAPEVQIDVLAPKATLPLLEFMPEVDQAILSPCNHGEFKIWARYQIARLLHTQQYDIAILLQNSFKSALIPFLAKIPRRIGYNKEHRRILLTDSYTLNAKKAIPYVKEQIKLIEKIGININHPAPIPQLIVSPEQQKTVADCFQIHTKNPILMLCPGAQYGPSKQWPATYFAEIAQHKIAQGWEVWIIGAKWDKKIADIICQFLTNNYRNFTGQTTLKEAVVLMSFAHTVLTNDSGLMHIAAALKKKIIALYGSSSPDYTPPLTDQATILSLNLACSPCFKKTCRFGHYDCLKKLTPDMLPDFSLNQIDISHSI